MVFYKNTTGIPQCNQHRPQPQNITSALTVSLYTPNDSELFENSIITTPMCCFSSVAWCFNNLLFVCYNIGLPNTFGEYDESPEVTASSLKVFAFVFLAGVSAAG